MKKIMLATMAVLGLNAAMAQTSNTQVKQGQGTAVKSNKPTIEVRAERSAERLKTELGLNEEQGTKLQALKIAKFKEVEALQKSLPGKDNHAARQVEIKKIADAYKTELKGFLTTEQYAKYEKSVEDRFTTWKKGVTAQPNARTGSDEEQRVRIELE